MNMRGCLFCGQEKGFFSICTDEHPKEHQGSGLACFCEPCFNEKSVEDLTQMVVRLWLRYWGADPDYSPDWFRYCIERKKGLNPTPIPRPRRPPTIEERVAELEAKVKALEASR